MRRTLDTSVGRVDVDFSDAGLVEITVYDESGWERRTEPWTQGDLAQGLAQIAGVPPSEAEVIEQELLAERPPADDSTVQWEASFSATGGKALALLVGVPAVLVAGIAAATWFLLR